MCQSDRLAIDLCFTIKCTSKRSESNRRKINSSIHHSTSNQKRSLSNNENMVMQLVLPSGSYNSNHNDNNNYLTATSIDDILDNNHRKQRHHQHSVSSQQDLYSSIGNGTYINHGYSTDPADAGGRSLVEESMPHTPSPSQQSSTDNRSTSPEEKKRIFRELLTKILSGVYALFIITVGVAVYVSDVINEDNPLAETFSLYLVLVALLYVSYLTIDITVYMKKRYKYLENIRNVQEEFEMKETPDGNYQLNIAFPKSVLVDELKHHYCLKKDEHSANIYLNIGAAGFCLGHLIHSGVLLGYQIVFLTSSGEAFYECASVATLILDFVYPIYSFILLYFIFKYSNIIINRHAALARFGIMHCLSSSLCFWVWTIFRETVESISNHSDDHDYDDDDDSSDDNLRQAISEISFLSEHPIALPLTSYTKRGAKLLTSYLNATARKFTQSCEGDESLKTIYKNYSPYLYPFSVEYSILVVGVLFIIWQNIGECKQEEEVTCHQRHQNTPSGNDDNLESNIVIHADCHSANKGLFGGIVIMVQTIASIILFFIAINDEDDIQAGVIINQVHSVILMSLMTISAIFAYRQITKLDYNLNHHNLLDDLLIFICMPAFFLNSLFCIIPAIAARSPLGISFIILEMAQVLIQTPFILDGLRRCSNSKDLRHEKPGRELVTFLIVSNVAMWITSTFEVKSHGYQDDRYGFYGYELWSIIGHMCIPLMMFYRFHSSVCLVDIWKFAYEPSVHEHKVAQH